MAKLIAFAAVVGGIIAWWRYEDPFMRDFERELERHKTDDNTVYA